MKQGTSAKTGRRSGGDMRGRRSWPLHRKITEYTGKLNFGLEIRELHRMTRTDFLKRIAGHGVTARMWPHLWALFQEDGLSQIELARMVNMEGPSVAATLDMMEQRGLVKRVPNGKDRRVTNVCLTNKAEAMRRVMMVHVMAANEQVLHSLTASEVATLFSLLRRIRESLEE